MRITVFEIACIVVVALTLWRMSKARGLGPLLRDYVPLAVAAWVGEDTSITFHHFYAYAPAWHLHVHHVPILVPLIWPLVILSARDVVSSMWPALGASRPLAVGALVAFDASLVEVVAVRAGLWTWAEPGHLGVPLIGILGWGYFAAGVDLALSSRRPWRATILGPLATHALVLVTWWGLFRWMLRGVLEPSSVMALLPLTAVALVLVLLRRRAGYAIPLELAIPRMIAASLFVALLLMTAPLDGPLWVHASCVAIPYFAATSFAFTGRKERRSTEAHPDSTAPSRR